MYITLADLTGYIPEVTLIQLSNDDTRATTVNVTNVETTIKSACELVDGYLHGRYELPLTSVPTMVETFCLDIARYYLYQRRPNGKDLPKAVTDAYSNSIKLLKEIQNGSLHLGIQATQQLQPEPGEFRTRAREKLDSSGY